MKKGEPSPTADTPWQIAIGLNRCVAMNDENVAFIFSFLSLKIENRVARQK